MILRFSRPRRPALPAALLLAGCWLAWRPAAAIAPAAGIRPARRTAPSRRQSARIVAVVNGDVISQADVDNRRRLFALSTGMPASPEVLDRLTPQVTRQLIDERLRLQEVQRRHVIVQDAEIAAAIREIEQRNGMPEGTLRRRLSADGVEFRTLIDQVRVQIGWGRVLRQVLGPQSEVTEADIQEQANLLKEQTGQQEFRIAEIFVPISDPAQAEEAHRFADTIIQQLRLGAPFAVVAAQFSQSQTALQGGDEGWVQPNQVDPAVLRVLQEMPEGAISNPIPVPGGLSIVTLHGKREIGHDLAHHGRRCGRCSCRSPRNSIRTRRRRSSSRCWSRHAAFPPRPRPATISRRRTRRPATTARRTRANCGWKGVTVPALRQILATLPVGKASQPLIADDGVAVIMVCSREQRNLGVPSKQELTERILNERVELASRQLMRDLQRRAVIDQRS